MPSDPAVVVHQLAVGRAPMAPLLRDIDLALAAGERLALVGANGTGKTALLATLALLTPPMAGRLVLFGREPSRLDRDERAALRRRIGTALGDGPWLEGASAAENLALPLRVLGEAEAAIAPVVGAFLDWLGLGARGDTPVTDLSAGERRLLGIARATVVRPDLLLLDEPLAGLDTRAASRAVQLVGELAGLGAAVVIASAEADTARRLGCEAVPVADGGLGPGAVPLRAAS